MSNTPPNNNYESEFCGSLPIHQINQIQPYGVLVVIETATGNIIQVSENTAIVFGLGPRELVGSRFSDHIQTQGMLLSGEIRGKLPELWTIKGRQFLALLHVKEPYIIAEIEAEPASPDRERSFLSMFQELKYSMTAVESASTTAAVCTAAVTELKRLSGFDKVMVCHFDEHWNGTVLAEVMEDGMESYMGFTFPASDIPKQARALYLENPYRFIPDRDYTPIKLYPVINPVTRSFIDLSDCNLRGVVGVDIEYLKNMQVVASMSTRILNGERLWGLIACHHLTAKNLDYQLCAVFEWMSHIVSARITNIQHQEQQAKNARLHDQYNHVIGNLFASNEWPQSLLDPENGVRRLFGGGGVLVSLEGKFHTAGMVPSREGLEDLLLWLHTQELKKVFTTDSLSSLYEWATHHQGVASGILVIPINWKRDEYVVVFRPEVIRVINWGGNPDERIRFEAASAVAEAKDGENVPAQQQHYHPRASFLQWQQKVSGTSLPWETEEVAMAENLRSFIYEYTHETARKSYER